jgi:hypothetical protein
MLTTTRTLLLGLVLAVLAIAPAAAVAKHGADDGVVQVGDDNGGLRSDDSSSRGGDDKRSEKRVAGSCTGRATAKLKAKPDDGRLEVEFEVDQNRNGVRWSVRIRRNGTRVVRTSAVTRAPSGSFSVERKIGNPAGADRIAARAVSPSGQVCRASLTI